MQGGKFCGHLGFEILRNFAEILRNFAEFCGNFAVCRNFAVTFLLGLRKICGQPEIAKKILRSQHQNFSKSQKGEFFHYKKVIFLNSPKDGDHFDDT
jgi:hypothetical protein